MIKNIQYNFDFKNINLLNREKGRVVEHASIKSRKPRMFKIKISKRLWIFQLGLFSPSRFNKKRCWSSRQTPVHWIIYIWTCWIISRQPASSEVSRKRVSLFAKMLNYCFNLKQQIEEQRNVVYWKDEDIRFSVQQKQIDKYRSKKYCADTD